MAFQALANTPIFRHFYQTLPSDSIQRSIHLNEMKIIPIKFINSINFCKKNRITFIVKLLKFRKDSGQFLWVTETHHHLK